MSIESILGPRGSIARRLPNYEPRAQQLEMANAIARAMDRPGHLMVEAGTGVGKSFGYLIPAILFCPAHQEEDRRLDAHDQLARTAYSERYSVPAVGFSRTL